MRIQRYESGVPTDARDRVWELLRSADREFVPPLSARRSSTQTDLSGSAPGIVPDGPREYFAVMSAQPVLLAYMTRGTSDAVAGFMAFRRDVALPGPPRPSLYVTTVVVDPACRRQGVTSAMYRELIALATAEGCGVSTRTWSSNAGHLALLEGLGFRIIERRVDDRGPNIDTVYLERAGASVSAGEQA